MSVQLHLRAADELIRVHDAVQGNLEVNSKIPSLADVLLYDHGELAALEWALGRRELSPLTSKAAATAPSPVELDRERRLGTDMLHRQIEMHHRGNGYVAGVEATLMWILDETDNEPS